MINGVFDILFSHAKSWKSAVYFILTAHFDSD